MEYSDPRDFGFRPETVMTALMPYEQFSSKTRRLILGIDMGIASVGVCLIDIRNHEIVLMASHIFKAPVEGKQKDISARQSGASIRRGYRSVRRTTKRRKNRKKAVRDIEKKYILIPDDADGQWFAIRKGEPDVLHLRGKALLYKLNGRELARILYAFADRRGYIDHGKGATDDDSGKVKKALSVNRKILDENGYETIAQYLLKQPTSRNREGDYRYMVDIEMVTDEVHTIFRHQRDLGSDIATEELEGEYLSALRWLTDTSARDKKIYSRVGYCTYLGAPEKRAASSLISFEMVRAYEKLSNIKIEHQGREATYISPEKRNEIVASLFAVSKNPKGKKDRSDDRHHAVDAAVIACCDQRIVKGIARVNSGRSNIKERERLRYESMPYPEFKAQVEAWIPCIVPTRTVSRTATGSLLKDTVYPYVGVILKWSIFGRFSPSTSDFII